ncbi:MAG: Fe-S cluster assembly protein SufB [Candidatus Magasanikbacteria bacterium]|jgi:Fe-S cluster assembly protein SufB|nr:Fe-S cluster assembly protein SufB [Candidatus Magasanikbacteria bacterium]MBT4221346.1 Fe-S cluster assembly protein SufB [Candidatus Magasanikbacteria bacterium]MBT4350806.1 Fe-S cluster assembly protein SufB [Candidatus Magasanikbacteria bacterium]MBT4541518.1 Fe-S cluster assembly protein SufB [Candidatus Magasanikbacteria bacterium]MBT6253470.1 Fe-S cluster assembly protein SufB [Candidatus Magasanikbacteria bacterium]
MDTKSIQVTSTVPDVSRELFDTPNKDNIKFQVEKGLTEDVVRTISSQKNEPAWMLEKRLAAFTLYEKEKMPTWGPDLSDLDLNELTYFVRPDATEVTSWDDVPDEIKKTFDRLGIPEAEKHALAGVGAQYDSDVVYHNLQQSLKDKGVVFENMDVAVEKYPELVQKYFMTQCVPINDHKFVMLHGAVWSGGTFIYVPKGVKVELPLQAYFRMNTKGSGQFEHTLIIVDEGAELQYIEGCSAPRYNVNSLHAGCVEIFVHKHARVRYSSIENWSKNTYNLNTKRALVDEEGVIEWINGNMGSGVTMLYPASILRGRGARSDSLGIAFAGEGQEQDTGSKVIHAAPNTTSTIRAKSISKDGGISTYRGYVQVTKAATNAKVGVECDALLLDEGSVSNTHPYMNIDTDDVSIAHEATVGKIGDDEIFYLMSRGLSEERAMQMVVSGFIEPIVKALPLEYALELNKLISLEMEGSVG